MQRRTLLRLAGSTAAVHFAPPLQAQQTNTKLLRIVVGFAAGGSLDTLARLVADQMTDALGRPVIVENKTGAGGRLAIETVRAAAPDGQTLMMVPHGPMVLFPHIYKSLRFDPAKDFAPIGRVATSNYCFTVAAQHPARDMASFRQWAAGHGNTLSFGSPGSGTVPHFLGIQIARQLGVPLAHIPYRGAAPALLDLIGGNLTATVLPLTDSLEMHKAGKVRILATAGPTRTGLLENIPTMKESALEVDVTTWYALYGPAAMAPAAVLDLNGALRGVLQQPATRERLGRMALMAAPSTPAELAGLQRQELARWEGVVKASGFTPED